MTGFNQREYQAVILGALLHDIGKLYQRAQKNPRSQDHAHWGEEWFENNLSEKLTPVFSETEKEIIRSAISNHHFSEKYISLADAISAGMDRIDLESEEKGDPFTDRLISIFSKISLSDKPKIERYHEIVYLGKENLLETFPIEEKKCSYKDYSSLLNDLEQEIKKIDFSGLYAEQTINMIYFLLWKYTWCIPSATYKHEPDVSLFDHLKTTAAIAGCLYAYQKENQKISLDLESKVFCLIGGDISGIQNYIFEVLTQQGKVAKRLRARSLFVQLISEIASHKILHAFNLPLCNLISSAGGNFYILVPNLNETDNKIKEIQKEFDEWTFNHLKGEISISLTNVDLCGKDLSDIPKVLDEKLKPNLNLRKYQPHKFVLYNNDRWFKEKFLFNEVIEGDEKVCQGCRKNPREELEKNEDNFCIQCLNDIKIGQSMPKAKYIAFFKDRLHEHEVLNYSFELWNEKDFKNTSHKESYLILRLNSPEVKPSVIGFKFLATHIPFDEENQPITFNDVAIASVGDKLLGYIKADVDNLGDILQKGFKKSKPSISRFSTFSNMLEIFFAGYLNVKLKNEFEDIYTVFSGGDDFFLIGPWNQVIDFAYLIRKKFTNFCAENPDLKFSSGIILSKPHEPLSYCTKIVEEKLKQSKSMEEKDGLTLFDQTVRWSELNKILKEAQNVIEWLEKKPPIVSRGFVHNLKTYGEMCQRYEETKDTRWLKFIPLLINDINRNLIKKEQAEAYNWALNLSPTIKKKIGEDNLPYLKTIIEYVLTYTRS